MSCLTTDRQLKTSFSKDAQIKKDLGTYILLDQFTIGDYGWTEPVLTQNRPELKVHGHTLYDVSVSIVKNADGKSNHHYMDINYKWIKQGVNTICGLAVPLPKIHPPKTPWSPPSVGGPFDFTDTADSSNIEPTESSERPNVLPDNQLYQKESPQSSTSGYIYSMIDKLYSDNYRHKQNGRPVGSRMRYHAVVYDKRSNDKAMKGRGQRIAQSRQVNRYSPILMLVTDVEDETC